MRFVLVRHVANHSAQAQLSSHPPHRSLSVLKRTESSRARARVPPCRPVRVKSGSRCPLLAFVVRARQSQQNRNCSPGVPRKPPVSARRDCGRKPVPACLPGVTCTGVPGGRGRPGGPDTRRRGSRAPQSLRSPPSGSGGIFLCYVTEVTWLMCDKLPA